MSKAYRPIGSKYISSDNIIYQAQSTKTRVTLTEKLKFLDTRSDNKLPSYYRGIGSGTTKEFKSGTAIGLDDGFCMVETSVPWGDTSGGRVFQWAVSTNMHISYRWGTSDDTSWSSWIKIPTKTSQLTNDAGFITCSSGSANNGYYWKFSNGLMITNQRYSSSTKGSWGTWGGTYADEFGTIRNYPATFSELPASLVNLETNSVNGWIATRSETRSQGTTSMPACYQLVRGTSSSGNREFILDVVAIGKWK